MPGIADAANIRPFQNLRGWTSRDILAGLTLAAITIPEQLATAKLGGFEPQVGLYAFLAATIGFAALGASRLLTAGADSTITPIFTGTLAALAASGVTSLGAVAVTLSLLVGMMLILAGLLRIGWVANLLSTPVITGFLAGVAIHILISQLPDLFGIAANGSTLPARAVALLAGLSALNPFTTAIGAGVFLVMLILERIDSRIPGALIGVALAVCAVLAFNLEAKGVTVLGSLPSGLPHFTFPDLDDFRQLVPLALIIALVVMMQTAAVIHSFPSPDVRTPNADRDFIGIGAGNVVSGLFGAFPVNASPPRTAVVAESGGTSQIGALTAAVIVLGLVMWGGNVLAHVPQAALAGVLLFVAQRIFRLGTMITIARQAPGEFVLVVLTIIAIVLLPIQSGAAIGIGLSLVHGVWMTTHTKPIELHRLPGTTVWWPAGAKAAGEREPGVAVVAYQAPLLFANAETFRAAMVKAIDTRAERPALVVLEASGIADIDFTAAQALVMVVSHCRDRGIGFAIARLGSIRAQTALGRFGVLAVLGPENLFHSAEEAVQALAPHRTCARQEDTHAEP
jgi:MFS superfamily sulfate permease-like transporter